MFAQWNVSLRVLMDTHGGILHLLSASGHEMRHGQVIQHTSSRHKGLALRGGGLLAPSEHEVVALERGHVCVGVQTFFHHGQNQGATGK